MSNDTQKPQTRIHPVTGELLTRGVRTITLTYKCLSEIVEMPGWYPDDDGNGDSDSTHTGADMKVSDEALKRMRAIHESKARKEE